jgi:hypothetical protein
MSIDVIPRPAAQGAFTLANTAAVPTYVEPPRTVAGLVRLLRLREAELHALYNAEQQEIPGGWSF